MAHWLDAIWRGRMSMRDSPLCRAQDIAAGRRLSPEFPLLPAQSIRTPPVQPDITTIKDPITPPNSLDCGMKIHIPQSRKSVYQSLSAYRSQ